MAKTMPASAERDDLIRKLYADGVSQSHIARQIGVSRQRLHQIMGELRIRKRTRVAPEDRSKHVVILIQKGKTGMQMAEHFGIGKSAIYRDIQRAKKRMPKAVLARYHENRYATLRAKAGQRDPRTMDAIDKRRGRILALIEKGWTLGRIAEKFQVTGQTIRNDLTDMGVNKRVEAMIHANRVAQSRRTRASKK